MSLLASIAIPDTVLGQSTKPLPRIAVGFDRGNKRLEKFLQGMRDLGYIEGRNFLLEFPDWSLIDRSDAPLDATFRELVGRKPDVIVVSGSPNIFAAKKQTSTIPIVMVSVGDAVGQGFAASLTHPGGNLTRFTILEEELSLKRLELLHQLLPKATRLGALHNPALGKLDSLLWNSLDPAAARFGVKVTRFAARSSGEVDAALAAIEIRRPQGAIVFNTPPFAFPLARKKLLEFFARHRIPATYGDSEAAIEGGLLSYGVALDENWRQSARFVDRILKGAKPSDLPVERATSFELFVNLKTAKAIGVTIPQSILLRADRVIE